MTDETDAEWMRGMIFLTMRRDNNRKTPRAETALAISYAANADYAARIFGEIARRCKNASGTGTAK